eukprot:TRINITY_DN1185_c0_g1_i1.p1 TRINITY_DN1185_c0_g1~~TRINITY_DN1185_c0_g1_i1.p1  ORF type:complete len:112 (-),score=18.49 TRINITY_DN1185_c0_g1_i1:54-389(-)
MLRGTSLLSVRSPRIIVPLRYKNTEKPLEDREKTFEDYSVQEHERKLLAELAKKMNVSAGDSKAQNQSDSTRQDLEALMLDMRKELMEEIGECKSEIVSLKFRLKRLESKH